MSQPDSTSPVPDTATMSTPKTSESRAPAAPVEIGGRDGLDPVRYGDWEKNGRCIDF